VAFIDLMLLNPYMVTELLSHMALSREEPLNSKTTFLVKYISGKADLIGQITAYVFIEYFYQRGVAALLSLFHACAEA
jgi:hypothetical protein